MNAKIETYEGAHNRYDDVDVTSSSELEGILKKLNGRNVSSIDFEFDSENRLTVGGGPEKFLVFISIRLDEQFFELQNPDGVSGKSHKLMTGGQMGEFDETMLVDFQLALKAVNEFFKTGQPSSDLKWKKIGEAKA